MTGSCARLRLGTLNVRTLSGRLPAVLELAAHADLDIVCLQETRLVDEGVKAATSAARAASWQFVPGPQTFDSRGKPTAGVALPLASK